jgi:hypothetical protein
MLVLIFELSPTSARDQILADGAKASKNIGGSSTRYFNSRRSSAGALLPKTLSFIALLYHPHGK